MTQPKNCILVCNSNYISKNFIILFDELFQKISNAQLSVFIIQDELIQDRNTNKREFLKNCTDNMINQAKQMHQLDLSCNIIISICAKILVGTKCTNYSHDILGKISGKRHKLIISTSVIFHNQEWQHFEDIIIKVKRLSINDSNMISKLNNDNALTITIPFSPFVEYQSSKGAIFGLPSKKILSYLEELS